jgi:hypothetical protein
VEIGGTLFNELSVAASRLAESNEPITQGSQKPHLGLNSAAATQLISAPTGYCLAAAFRQKAKGRAD